MLLDRDPVNRGMRHSCLKRLPVLAIIKGNIKGILCADVKQAAPNRVLADAMRVAEHAARYSVCDRLPCLAIVIGFVDKRIADVDLVKVHSDVGGSGFITGWFDVADCSPRRQT